MAHRQLVLLSSVFLFISANGYDVSINVYGGIEATEGMFPSVGYVVESDGISRCGATLIDFEWAITAAHCFFTFKPGEPTPSRVVFGETSTGVNSPWHHECRFDLIIHDDYNEETLENDIALLHLHDRAKVTNYVKPVDISTSLQELDVHSDCHVVGWGLTEHQEQSSILKYGQVNLLSSSECIPSWPNYNDNLMLCAGSTHVTACEGDGGGPLFGLVEGSRKLVGIISHGIHNCDARVGLNSVYTRVAAYTDWIEETMYSTGNLASPSCFIFLIIVFGNTLTDK